jgi:hypothetical protein
MPSTGYSQRNKSLKKVSVLYVTIQIYIGCVRESGDFKNFVNSKRFQLCSYNTYEHNVHRKAFWFFTVNTMKTTALLPEINIIQMTTIPL